MQGQAHHFVRYAPEKIEYGIRRYTNETKRLYGVLDKHLSEGREWIAAGQYTIADIANFAWVYEHAWAGKTLLCSSLPHCQYHVDLSGHSRYSCLLALDTSRHGQLLHGFAFACMSR